MHLVAGALAAVTEQGPLDPTNCVAIASERACKFGSFRMSGFLLLQLTDFVIGNVGDVVRVSVQL